MAQDMSKYLALYLAEAKDHLEAIERAIIDLDKNSSAEAMNELFRHAHSLKGMSASMGLEVTAVVAHRLEDILDVLRATPHQRAQATTDLLFASVDELRRQAKRIAGGQTEEKNSGLVERLEAHVTALTGKAPVATRVAKTAPLIRAVEETAAATASPQQSGGPPSPGLAPTVRVRPEILDQFLDAAGELLAATAHLKELTKNIHTPSIDANISRLQGVVRRLHASVMQTRLVPAQTLTNHLPRAARDVASRYRREIDFDIKAGNVDIDRTVVEQLIEPLIHLVRNAVCHGIESPDNRKSKGKPPTGKVTVSVVQERESLVVRVTDDGAGIDPERLRETAVARGVITAAQAANLTLRDTLRLCLRPGISTAVVVDEFSGRGVGLDAVAKTVEHLGGGVDIESTRQVGTTFTVTVPRNIAVIEVLLVDVAGQLVGFPLTKVLFVTADHIGDSSATTIRWGDEEFRRYQLARLFGWDVAQLPRQAVLVVDAAPTPMALVVDTLQGHEEVVLKPLVRPLGSLPGLLGTAILASGQPIFVVDVSRLSVLVRDYPAPETTRSTPARSGPTPSSRIPH